MDDLLDKMVNQTSLHERPELATWFSFHAFTKGLLINDFTQLEEEGSHVCGSLYGSVKKPPMLGLLHTFFIFCTSLCFQVYIIFLL